jgi:hypothetical protein
VAHCAMDGAWLLVAFGHGMPCPYWGKCVMRKERVCEMRQAMVIEMWCYVGTGRNACATRRQRRRPEVSGTKGERNGERRYELLAQDLDCDA